MERSAQHALVCNKLKSRHARHRLGNDIISRALKSAETPATLVLLDRSRSDGKRPDGASLLAWKRGKPLVWDYFTSVHRQAASYKTTATCRWEGAPVANAAEEEKEAKYQDLTQQCLFQPVALETLGGLGTKTLEFLRKLEGRISATSGDRCATIFVRQRLAVAVLAGNAACVRESCDGLTF